MVKIFGDFNDTEIKSREFLKLRFSPSSIPLQQRWRNNGLSADFLAEYLTTFFPGEENDPNTIKRETELKDAVSYIANELLENAMKFNDDSSVYPISIQFQLYHDHLRLCIRNSIPTEKIVAFQSFLTELQSINPQDFYIRQIERANEDENISSGLGLLTMIDDYGAKLGWKFETFQVTEVPNESLCSIENFNKFNVFVWFKRLKKRFFATKNPTITVVTTMVQLAI